MKFNFLELDNGIRIIHKPTKNEVAHCGFIIDTGSRDEDIATNGITHFIEHAIFKGTKKRKAFHILNRIDNVGGEINAFTTKENTSIYASFTKMYFERALELLTDILFNSTYPEYEINKEKDVIIDEIFSYQDSPYEQIYDDFEEIIFKEHPLGMNILGTVEGVKKINRTKILDFIKTQYLTSQIVFSVVGDIPFKKIEKLAKKYLNDIPQKNTTTQRYPFNNYQPTQKEITKDISQTHCMIGNVAYPAFDKNKNGLILLNNILGGPAMNSRLNLGIREKYGFTYNIESSYNVFSDIGLFYIYLSTDQKNIAKSIALVNRELKILRDKKISSSQLQKAKQQIIGQIALSEENNCNVMLEMGKSLIVYNKVDGLKETYEKINAITENQLLGIANEIFDENKLSSLTYLPK
ncbi:MAG: peptidase M16 [Flavobacteriales bacterium CG_4_9_14_3_um_filter_32_8]|nr:MAG: peptidase M16 [Flavobacteriales bacterium CG_4_9_14_3_um_filter_32_8]